MAVLENLKPYKVFHYFEEICQIPHGTENTKALSDYCVAFANERGLEVIQDKIGNILIKKPGTEGYENSEPVIIQGHMDMVCEKTIDSDHDFTKDPIDLYIEDGFVRARNTTLGAVDGIALAFSMALLDSNDIPHPPLEVIFTVDEETTMIGAEEFDLSLLKGKRMINMDSDVEGVFTVGCAGGVTFLAEVPFEKEEVTNPVVRLHLKGLQGGHSGNEIHLQRINANKHMGKLLQHLVMKGFHFNLVAVNGGEKENVITFSNVADITVAAEEKDALIAEVSATEALWIKEYGVDEPELALTAEDKGVQTLPALTCADTKKISGFLAASPHGVLCFDRNLKTVVETSLNLGVVKTFEDHLFVNYFIRSSIDTKRDEAVEELTAFVEAYGAKIETNSEFPAWSYNPESELRPVMVELYKEMYGKDPIVEAIHAGLECGIFYGKRPDIDYVSFGPQANDIHSVNEALGIESTERVWDFFIALLGRCK